MDVGGIFRNLFRLQPKDTNVGQNQESTVETSPRVPNPGIYDDTDLAIHSRAGRAGVGQGQRDHVTLSKLPTFRDLEDTGNNDDVEEVNDRNEHGLRRRGSSHGPNFIFGDMFAIVREMFGEMDRSMREMDEFFSNSNNDDNSSSHFFNFNLPGLEGPKPESTDKSQTPDYIRELVLKPKPEKRSPTNERIDPELDDLFKDSKLSPVVPRAGGGRMLEDAWKGKDGTMTTVPSPTPNTRFQYSRTVRQYKSSPDGTIIQGKTIRETNEGKEIITYRKNDKGEVEENKEFIPRGSACDEGSSNGGEDLSMMPMPNFPSFSRIPFHDFFFPPRPRM